MTRLFRLLGLDEHWRVWLLSAGLWAGSIALWITTVRHLDPVSDAATIPAWLIAVLVLLAESWVVHLHFRSESGSFSFFEVPLILGLLFTDPGQLWVATTAGAVVALVVVRRQPPIKSAFNGANLSLRVAIAAIMLDHLLGSADALEPTGWVVIGVTMLVTSTLEVGTIAAVISITEGRFQTRTVMNILAFGLVVAAGNTVQALITALLLVAEPASLLLLVFSTVVLFTAYRAYISEREQREKVEFLYTSTRALTGSNETTMAMTVLLEEAAEMFRAGFVELFLFPTVDGSEPTSRFSLVDGSVAGVAARDDEHETAMHLVDAAPQPVLVDHRSHPAVLAYAQERQLRDAMVGALRAGDRAAAVLVVADRLGRVSTFTKEDLLLFETLVQHAAVALENDQLAEAVGQLKTLERELAHQAAHDSLTGLANRALLGRHVDEALADQRHPVSLLFVDLDDFKLVNDTMGHAAGDAVLVEASRRLVAAIRPTDTAARLGGDEFAVILIDHADPAPVAERLLRRLQEPYELSGQEARIGASIGIAHAGPHSSASTLVAQADVAMYVAKEQGKGTIATYAEEMHHRVAARQQLRTRLRSAVADGDLCVYYQPIVDLAALRIVGAEALVRWRSPEGLVSPDSFIPEAERSGLIVPIDSFVLRQVLDDIPTLRSSGRDDLWVTSNMSTRSLHDPELFDTVRRAIVDSRLTPGSLVVEVTETALMRDPDLAVAQLDRLREHGVRVALDDFGTGYSSLAYLRRIPVDLLKIAQPFVTDLTRGDDTFLRAMVELAHTLDLEVIAEGIEQKRALDELQALDCEYGQGFLLARPMPIDELIPLLESATPQGPISAWGHLTRA